MSEENNSMEAFYEAAANASEGTPTPEAAPAPVAEAAVEATPTETVTEQPVTEAPITDEPAPAEVTEAETPQLAAIVEEKIREVPVEKIVEKYPEFKSERSKELYEAIINGDDDAALNTLIEYGREKKRDYNTMTDIEVLKSAIKKEKPHWSAEEVELKITETYGDELVKIDLNTINKDEEPDEYEDAVKHNKQVERNLLRLSRDAKDTRQELIEKQSKLELPKIEYKKPEPIEQEQPSAEAIAEANRVWEAQVEEQTKDFNAISVRIGDRQLTYNPTDGDKQATVTAVKSFNPQKFFQERGWIGEDGKSNAAKIAEDLFKLNNFEKIVNAYSSQAENNAKKDVLKDIKNVVPANTSAPAHPVSFVDAYAEAWEKANK